MRESMLLLIKKLKKLPLVFDINTAALVLGKKRKNVAVYLKKLIDAKILFRISKGLYAKTNDPVLIAGNLPFPSYITGRFALFYYGIGEAPYTIDVVTTQHKRDIKHFGIKLHIFKTLGKFSIREYADGKIKIATLEQAKKDLKRFKH